MNKKVFLIGVFLFFVFCCGCMSSESKNGYFTVKKVVDGDTIVLDNAKSVRYIGIDAPETRIKIGNKWIFQPQQYAQEATDYNKKLVEGRKILIEFDVEKYDKYSRWLGYVFIDGILVNEEILKQGLARLFKNTQNRKYYNRLKKAQEYAKSRRIGIWSDGEFINKEK